MALKPGQHNGYNPSGITYKGSAIQGYGNDSSHETSDIIYIGSHISERVVALKAFLDSFDLNVTKNSEQIAINSFSTFKQILENECRVSFSLSLNIPAHSYNESRNNLAKIAELQRMIAPRTITTSGTDELNQTKVLLSVFFKNLLNSGVYYNPRNTPKINDFNTLKSYGVIVNCLEINYEPDVSAGYFKSDMSDGNFMFPKNIKLNLNLDVIHEEMYPHGHKYIRGYTDNGLLRHNDQGFTPFNIPIRSTFGEDGNYKPNTIYYQNLNNDSRSTQRRKDNGYIFISNNILNEKTKLNRASTVGAHELYEDESSKYQRRRWVVFDIFLQNFTRNVKFEKVDQTDSDKDFSSGYTFSKYSAVEYSLSFNVLAGDLMSSKKNLGKIQILSRLLAKRQKATFVPDVVSKYGADRIGYTKYDTRVFDNITKVYVPSMIEKGGANRFHGNAHDRGGYMRAYNNALELNFISFTCKINTGEGFFKEGGKLYPKSMTITLNFVQSDMSLMRNFGLTIDGSGNRVNTLKEKDDYLFPFSRKYTTIKKE